LVLQPQNSQLRHAAVAFAVAELSAFCDRDVRPITSS
jgi:hypothetical protein